MQSGKCLQRFPNGIVDRKFKKSFVVDQNIHSLRLTRRNKMTFLTVYSTFQKTTPPRMPSECKLKNTFDNLGLRESKI